MAPSRATISLSATFAARVKQGRAAVGLTQRGLADRIGNVDQMAVSRWERGIHRPTDENLMALAEIFGQPVSWFYTVPEDVAA